MAAQARMVHLNQSGKMWDKNSTAAADGLVTSLSNHCIKDRHWKIERVCAHRTSGDIASADERGQVYVYSVALNTYNSVRLASTPVSAIEFIHCRKSRLIVAYVHGTVAVVDTSNRTVVGHLQLTRPAVITRICCHPVRPVATLVADDGSVSIWDLRTLLCTRTLVAQEPVIDIEYSRGGELLAIVYQSVGAVYYHVEDGQPELKCSLPASERQPRWVSYCSSPCRDRVLLAGDNGMLYLFDGQHGLSMSSTQYADAALFDNDSRHVKGFCSLLSVAEVPVQFGNVTSLAALCTSVESVSSSTASALGLTVAAATSKGRVLLLNVTEERSALGGDRRHGCGAIPTHWIWRVMADVALSDKTAEPPVLSTLTPALAAAGRVAPSLRHSKDLSDHHRSSTALTGRDRMTSIENASYKKGAGPELANHLAAIPDKDKRCDNEYFMSFVVRNDGNLNIYDWGETISTDNARRSIGDIRGLLLRHRSCGEPYLAMVEKSTLSPKRRPTREMPTGGKIPAQRVAQLPAEDENRAPKAVNRITSYGNSQRASSSKQTAKEFIKSISRTSGIESKQATETAGMSSSTAGPAASTSIFDISTGTQFEKGSSKMSKAKLMYFLDKNERYPDAYRPLIWRYLLQLPENAAAFAELVKRGTHPAYSSKTLARKYPLESSRLFSKLQGMCSHLAHWSSIFGEASYVPQLCFPFVLIYDNDELAALETVMSLLMWWGYSWHVCHPNPPAQLTDTFDALLLHHDPTLHKHLKSLELSPGLISWRLTYSVYSEFLSKESWLRVMDFVFTNFESLELMALLPIALIRLSSASLLCSYNTDHILKFFSSQQDLKASSIVNMTKHMLAKTPKPMLLACYRGAKSRSHDTFVSNKADITDLNGAKRVAYNQHGRKDGRDGLPGAKNRSSSRRHDEASMRGSDLDDELASWRATAGESVRQSLAAQAGAPVFPLPRERYPAYDGYPQAMIDWELRKRSVQMALDDELECREDVLRELEKRIEELDNDHEHWMANHKAATENEVRSRYELMEREKDHMRQLAVMEELISRKRLSALTSLEKASKEELRMLDEATVETKRMLDAGEEHLRRKMDATLSIQRHREAGEAAEAILSDRMHKLYVDRARDERMKALSETLQRAETELTSRTAQMSSELQHLEEMAKAKRTERLVVSKNVAEQETSTRLRSSMLDRLSKLAVEREDKLIALEREAALKVIREEAREAEEVVRRSQALYQKQEEHVSKESAARLAVQALQASKDRLAEAVAEVRRHSEELLAQERVLALKEAQSRVKARGSEVALMQADSLQAQMQHALQTQIEAERELARIKALSLTNETGVLYRRDERARDGLSERRRQNETSYSHKHSEAASGHRDAVASSDGSTDSDNVRPLQGQKKRSFAAVNALLGIDDEVISHRPESRGKRVDRRAHLDYESTEVFGPDSSSGLEEEAPLPSQSVLSPQDGGMLQYAQRALGEKEDSLMATSQFQMRFSANEDWSDGLDIQFPASGRLNERSQLRDNREVNTFSEDVQEASMVNINSGNRTDSATASRREVRWQEETGSSEESATINVGRVDDVVKSTWTGFNYMDRAMGDISSDEDIEDIAMRRLAEKNLDVLGRLRAIDRLGGDTVDEDVQDLLRETAAGGSSDQSSGGVSGEVADGDDDDSALWNFGK